MRIAFYHEATWPWTGRDLRTHGFEGTETGLGNIARALARGGHDVTVFNRTPYPNRDGGVWFRNVAELPAGSGWDVLVCMSPVPGLRSVDATLKIHWSPEVWLDVLPEVQGVFSISPYHTRTLVDVWGIAPERIYTTCCPIEWGEYEQPLLKTPGRLIYCSVPDRGLIQLPDIYRRVRAEVPWASLVVTGDYTLRGESAPGNAGYRQAFADLPDVRFLGRVPRPRLVELQKTSVLHAFPCIFREMLCLASVECQAAGTPTVSTRVAALPTTVEDGVTGLLVEPGVAPPELSRPYIDDPGPEFRQAFADRIVTLLTDTARCEEMARRARERARRLFDADVVAEGWLRQFDVLRGARSGASGGAAADDRKEVDNR